MYSQLTEEVLVGGWVSKSLNVNFLSNSGVTHLLNACNRTDEMVKNQFETLDVLEANRDDTRDVRYWRPVFAFTRKAVLHKNQKLYIHICPEARASSPVVVYASLRALGFGVVRTRHKMEELHPILNWHERALHGVDLALTEWARETGVDLKGGRYGERVHQDSRTVGLQLLAGRDSDTGSYDLPVNEA